MKGFTFTILFLFVATVGLIWLAGGNLSKTDLLNPVTSGATARRTDAETQVYARENDIRLAHLERVLAEDLAHQQALDQQELEDVRHAAEMRDFLILSGLVILAAALGLPAGGIAYYWICRAAVLLVPVAVPQAVPPDGKLKKRVCPCRSAAQQRRGAHYSA